MSEEESGEGLGDKALKVINEMKGIKKEEWGVIHENLKTLKGFIDMNAEGVLSSFTESLATTIQLKFEEILAPLKNEWNALINDLLEPLMPMLQQIVTFLIPLVQWIADCISEISNFLFGGGSGHDTFMNFKDWAITYKTTHPTISAVDLVLAYMQYLNTPISNESSRGGYQIER